MKYLRLTRQIKEDDYWKDREWTENQGHWEEEQKKKWIEREEVVRLGERYILVSVVKLTDVDGFYEVEDKESREYSSITIDDRTYQGRYRYKVPFDHVYALRDVGEYESEIPGYLQRLLEENKTEPQSAKVIKQTSSDDGFGDGVIMGGLAVGLFL